MPVCIPALYSCRLGSKEAANVTGAASRREGLLAKGE